MMRGISTNLSQSPPGEKPCEEHGGQKLQLLELPRHQALPNPRRSRTITFTLEYVRGGGRPGRSSAVRGVARQLPVALGGSAGGKATLGRDGLFRPLIEMCSRACRCVKVCRRNRPDEPDAYGRGGSMDETVWVGIDVGRHEHHAAAVDEAGVVLWSRRLPNDQPAIEALVDRVADMKLVVWAIDMTAPESALLRGCAGRTAPAHPLCARPGRAQHDRRFAGEGKTDARDAVVIAQTVRLRGDLATITVPDDVAIELDLLTGHRNELVAERTRGINRLRGLLTRIFPALERCFDYSTLTGLAFLTRFATPAAIAVASDEEIYDHLRGHGVRRPTIPKMITKARARWPRRPSPCLARRPRHCCCSRQRPP